MKKRKHNRKTRHLLNTQTHPHAAGVDVGAEELVAAVPPDRDQDPVRTFSAFTPGLHALRDWLKACGIETVAMESTGNYWIPAYQLLEAVGIEVCLVNARHVKAVPGKKTDVCDAQWLQQLHAAGLLRGSFRPDQQIVPLRYLMRHRAQLVRTAARELQLMQKVLTEMNIKLHHVFSDLDGLSAMRIIEAIQGDWRAEYLFVLAQCLERWKSARLDVEACDREIETLVAAVEVPEGPSASLSPTDRKRPRKNDPKFDVRREALRFFGVDLSSIDGVGPGCLAVLMSELGTGEQILTKFRSGSAFASWLGLCPDNRITGGKVLKSKTRPVANRSAQALRMAAQSLGRAHSELGNYTRRMKARLGKAEGITAVAHKLARIIYAMIQHRRNYDEQTAFKPNATSARRRMNYLQKQAAKLGFQLVPQQQET